MSSTVRFSNPSSIARSKAAFRIARRVSSFFCSRRPRDASSSKTIEDDPKLKLAQCASFPYAYSPYGMPRVTSDTAGVIAGSSALGASGLPTPIGQNSQHQHNGPAHRNNCAGEDTRIRYERTYGDQGELARDYCECTSDEKITLAYTECSTSVVHWPIWKT